MFIIGFLGYFFNRINIPLAPIILGMVLGEVIESNYRTAMALSGGSFKIFVNSPLSLAFLFLIILTIGLQIKKGSQKLNCKKFHKFKMIIKEIESRAKIISKNNNDINHCLSKGLIKKYRYYFVRRFNTWLVKTKVRKYFVIFGHGSTDFGEILRIYEKYGVTKTFNFRNEVEMSHAATTLSWQYNEIPAVVTSIGPGALQAMAGSLSAASNGIGVYHIYGDETTYGEGYNMQQIPKNEQDLYGKLTALMSESYVFHTPESLRDGLRRGYLKTHHPYKSGPFYFYFQLIPSLK